MSCFLLVSSVTFYRYLFLYSVRVYLYPVSIFFELDHEKAGKRESKVLGY